MKINAQCGRSCMSDDGLLPQTPGSEFGNDSDMNMHAPRGLSSRVSVTSHGSGGGFSVKDGAGGSHKTRKTSIAGSATFSHSLMNLTQVTMLGRF